MKKNSINYLWRLLAVCGLIVAFAACNNDDDATTGGNVTIVSPTEGIISLAEQEKHPVTFKAEGDWLAVPSHGWLKVNQIQGSAGEQTLELTVAKNETFDERTGSLIIKDRDSGKSIEISVKQGALGAHFVFEEGKETMTELIIDSELREILGTLRITSNYDWKINIPKEHSWLTYTEGKAEGNTRMITFYAEPDKLQGYEAVDAGISFDYVAETRAPGNENYTVRFPGITPKLELDIESAELEDPYDEGEYRAKVVVSSNVAWDFASMPEFLSANVIGGNTSAKFFEVESTIFLALKNEKLDTGLLTGTVIFKDASMATDGEKAELPVSFAGVGGDYVSFDSSVFQSSDPMQGFLFDPVKLYDDSWNQTNQDKMEQLITVKAADAEDVVVYFAKAQSAWGGTLPVESWSIGADPVDYRRGTRSLVQNKQFMVWVKDRNEDTNDLDKIQNRYFTMFVVSKKKAPTFDDLFDAEGYVKEEFMSPSNSCTIGQRGLQVKYDFWSPDLTEGQVLEVPAAGKTFTIQYETNAPGMSLYSNVMKFSDKPDDWVGERVGEGHEMLSLEFSETPGVLKLIVKPNKAGETRMESCAFGGYVEGADQDLLLISFTIQQAGK